MLNNVSGLFMYRNVPGGVIAAVRIRLERRAASSRAPLNALYFIHLKPQISTLVTGVKLQIYWSIYSAY